MSKTITVDVALKKGRKMALGTYYTSLVLTAIVMVGLFFRYESAWFILVCLAVMFVIPIICENVALTYWKLWAFDKVENVHDLHEQALSLRILNKRNSFLEKLEMLTPQQKKRWYLIKTKLNEPYAFDDGISVPPETLIGYRKGREKNILILLGVGILASVVFAIFSPQDYPFGLMVCVFLVFVGRNHYYAYRNNNVQIMLNTDGMMTNGTPFYSWEEIIDVDVRIVNVPKGGTVSYLTYNCPSGSIEIEISSFGVHKDRLLKLVAVYRSRYEIREEQSTH